MPERLMTKVLRRSIQERAAALPHTMAALAQPASKRPHAAKGAAAKTATYPLSRCSPSDFTPGCGVVVTHRGTALPDAIACEWDTFVGHCLRTDPKRRTVTVRTGAR